MHSISFLLDYTGFLLFCQAITAKPGLHLGPHAGSSALNAGAYKRHLSNVKTAARSKDPPLEVGCSETSESCESCTSQNLSRISTNILHQQGVAFLQAHDGLALSDYGNLSAGITSIATLTKIDVSLRGGMPD